MRRIAQLIAALCLVVVTAGSCTGSYRKINMRSAGIESFKLTGMRTFDAVLSVEIDNPAGPVTIKDIEATVKHDSRDAITVVSDKELRMEGKCVKSYLVPVKGTVAADVSLVQMAVWAKDFDSDRFTVDIHARAEIAPGFGRDFARKDIPMSRFFSRK